MPIEHFGVIINVRIKGIRAGGINVMNKEKNKELNIKETTIRAIRKQQNHCKTTKNLTKGEW